MIRQLLLLAGLLACSPWALSQPIPTFHYALALPSIGGSALTQLSLTVGTTTLRWRAQQVSPVSPGDSANWRCLPNHNSVRPSVMKMAEGLGATNPWQTAWQVSQQHCQNGLANQLWLALVYEPTGVTGPTVTGQLVARPILAVLPEESAGSMSSRLHWVDPVTQKRLNSPLFPLQSAPATVQNAEAFQQWVTGQLQELATQPIAMTQADSAAHTQIDLAAITQQHPTNETSLLAEVPTRHVISLYPFINQPANTGPLWEQAWRKGYQALQESDWQQAGLQFQQALQLASTQQARAQLAFSLRDSGFWMLAQQADTTLPDWPTDYPTAVAIPIAATDLLFPKVTLNLEEQLGWLQGLYGMDPAALQAVLQSHPADWPLWQQAYQYRLSQGATQDAAQLLQQYRQSVPDDPRPLVVQVQSQWEQFSANEKMTRLAEALRLANRQDIYQPLAPGIQSWVSLARAESQASQPKTPLHARLGVALYHWEFFGWDKAEATLNRWFTRPADQRAITLLKAVETGNWALADTLYPKTQGGYVALQQLALARYEQQSRLYSQAANRLQGLARHNPGWPQLWAWQVQCWVGAGRFSQAKTTLARGFHRNGKKAPVQPTLGTLPNTPPLVTQRALLYWLLEQNAVETAHQLLDFTPQRWALPLLAGYWHWLGLSALKQGDTAQAYTWLLAAYRAEPLAQRNALLAPLSQTTALLGGRPSTQPTLEWLLALQPTFEANPPSANALQHLASTGHWNTVQTALPPSLSADERAYAVVLLRQEREFQKEVATFAPVVHRVLSSPQQLPANWTSWLGQLRTRWLGRLQQLRQPPPPQGARFRAVQLGLAARVYGQLVLVHSLWTLDNWQEQNWQSVATLVGQLTQLERNGLAYAARTLQLEPMTWRALKDEAGLTGEGEQLSHAAMIHLQSGLVSVSTSEPAAQKPPQTPRATPTPLPAQSPTGAKP